MYTYIVIDDEELTRKGTIAKLKPLADKVSCLGEAGDGREALLLIESCNPDIIITDMHMPNMSGSDLLPLLTASYPEKPIIVISGYKDFEYTKQAIRAKAVDYLLKPFGREEIQESIHNAICFIKNSASVKNQLTSQEHEKEYACYEFDIQSLKNSILGYHTEKLTLASKKLSYMNDTHRFMLMTLHTGSSLDETDMHNYLTENGFGDLALYLQHSNNGHLGFLLLFIPEHSILSPEALGRQIAKSLLALFETEGISISIGISKTHDEITLLHSAFLETVAALNEKKIQDSGLFYFYGESVLPSHRITWEKQEELLFRVEAGMGKEVRELVAQLFAYLRHFPDATYSDMKYYCLKLSDLTRSLMTGYIQQLHTGTVSSSTQNILNTMFDLGELEDYYMQFFINISDILYEKGIYATEDVIQKIKTYVNKNYSKNLSLELLSCFFYMNRSYLSHLFREKTGGKFVDYLNDIRINHAKEMLTGSDKKMYQIAKAAGYDNIKYFFRVFKNKTGKTPEQWKSETAQTDSH